MNLRRPFELRLMLVASSLVACSNAPTGAQPSATVVVTTEPSPERAPDPVVDPRPIESFVWSEEVGMRDTPSVALGTPVVNGRLPPLVVERIARQNFGRFVKCHEAASKAEVVVDVVNVAFTIARDGSVVSPSAKAERSTDATFIACLEKAFSTLSFPQPEGGKVTVALAIAFDRPMGPVTVRGRPIPEVTVSDVAETMKALGYADVAVKLAGSAPSPMLVVGAKDGVVVTTTFVSFSRAPTDPSVTVAERARLEAQGAVYVQGDFLLAVEIPGKKSEARALLRALLGEVPRARQTPAAR